ncbi:metal-binding protein [Chryseobacterium indologenes]|uniref:Ada metal-binding domain-containing protein n=1 Tax=Chryseobacterium indologenes TaxID=253 RepID=UPI000F50705C|nr:Ada metal-binding domain-containing protein [Chryseobacterium indologenes]AYZ35445.1 metal-binding protein [Chryseobacterium indologenes]MBF6644197.1 metal-binding protein [Chryseobacterium indologenes]MBU3047919.1 metal-binding protein [Chryseobacterium indologenes]MEB4759796.1 metal-binding protein [Chryseobacterium indologenes]QQQ72089.1 metal-binding protein [Chryseobacterium indologenes]
MIHHSELSAKSLRSKIHNREISFGGNKKLKIYGRLSCRSGKRMKIENRIFFTDEKEAVKNNFRPCAHCMKEAYDKWKYIMDQSPKSGNPEYL